MWYKVSKRVKQTVSLKNKNCYLDILSLSTWNLKYEQPAIWLWMITIIFNLLTITILIKTYYDCRY